MNGSKLQQHIAGVQSTVPDIEMTETAGTSTGSPGGATGPITKAFYQRRSNRRHWRVFERVATVVLDAILIGLSFWLAYYFRFTVLSGHNLLTDLLTKLRTNFGEAANLPTQNYPFTNFRFLGVSVVIGLMLIFALRGLYSIRLTGNWFRQAWTIVSSTTLGMAFLITYYFVFQPPSNSRLLVPFVWATAIVVLCVERLIVSTVMGMLYRRGFGETRLLVVGSGRLGKLIMQHIVATPSLGYSIVGFLHDMSEEEEPGDFGRFKMLGTLEDLSMVIRSMQIDEVIIALPSNLHEQSIRSVRLCERLGTSFKLVPDLYEYELSLSRIDMDAIEGIPLIGIKQESLNTVQQLVTRVVDCGLSVIGLVVGLPFWLCIALAIKLTSPGVVVYRQTRIGWNGRPFKVFKFRTMYKDAEQRLDDLLYRNEAQGPLFKIKDDPRITPVGKFLRRTSFDEFPQLLNVIKGEMSLVGPRPPLPQEVAAYADWQKARLSIKPGMTGLWQVRGRSDISFDEGVLMDLYYIENWSLRLYFMILLRTIPAVLFSRGAY